MSRGSPNRFRNRKNGRQVSFKMEIIKGRLSKPQKVTLYGPEGVGKSTFASMFPDPLFIDTEDSTVTMDVARFPKPSSWTMLLSQVEHVKQNPGICKTLVVDTTDWAERLCIEHVCAKGKVDGIEGFGYGKGYVYLKEEFGRFLNKLQEIIEIGINVMVTAHAEIKKIEQPEEIGGFDHWQLKLSKTTMPLLKEWSDILLFANYKVHVVNVDNQGAQKGKNKAQGGKRVMYTTHTPWWDAKNRHGLKDELPFDFAEIAHIFGNEAKKETVNIESVRQSAEKLKEILGKKEVVEQIVEPEQSIPEPDPKPLEESEKPAGTNDLDGLPRALVDLMTENKVTIDEIQQAVASRGYYPVNTPVENYATDFVDGVLVGAWEQVFQIIQAFREDLPF